MLLLPPLVRGVSGGIALFDAFYRSGALVFGGGHAVLPLLRDAVVTPGWVSNNAFLAGYGAAQAVPGPLFTFAAYLGAVMRGSFGGVAGAVITLVAIFLPGLLLLMGTLPFWDGLRTRPLAQAAMRGVKQHQDGGDGRDGGARPVRAERARHAPHRLRHDRDRHELQPVQQPRAQV